MEGKFFKLRTLDASEKLPHRWIYSFHPLIVLGHVDDDHVWVVNATSHPHLVKDHKEDNRYLFLPIDHNQYEYGIEGYLRLKGGVGIGVKGMIQKRVPLPKNSWAVLDSKTMVRKDWLKAYKYHEGDGLEMQYELKNKATERLKRLCDEAMVKKEEWEVRNRLVLDGKPVPQSVKLTKSQKNRARVKKRIAEAREVYQDLSIERFMHTIQNSYDGRALDPELVKQNLEWLKKLVTAIEALEKRLDAQNNTSKASYSDQEKPKTSHKPVTAKEPKSVSDKHQTRSRNPAMKSKKTSKKKAKPVSDAQKQVKSEKASKRSKIKGESMKYKAAAKNAMEASSRSSQQSKALDDSPSSRTRSKYQLQ